MVWLLYRARHSTFLAAFVLPSSLCQPVPPTSREQYDRGGSSYSRGHSSDRRDYDRRAGEYDRRGGGGEYDRRYDRNGSSRDEQPPRRRSRSRSRSRDRDRSRGAGGGRDASDVFKDRAGGAAASTDVRSRYGDASGKLDLGGAAAGGSKRSADEVFRLGGRGYR